MWLSDAGLLPTMARMAQVEEYELNVLPGKKRELPVYSVERPDQKIALTIDAAWEDDKTAFILETLARYDVKATFFLCGVWVEAYPEHVKEIAAAGHEIGNHSLTHPHMNELTAEQVQQEISALDDQIEALTGKRCTKFRAPYGEYNDTVIKAVRALGYEAVQWDVDTIDWKKERSAAAILETVLPRLAPRQHHPLPQQRLPRSRNTCPRSSSRRRRRATSSSRSTSCCSTAPPPSDANGRQQPAA